MDPQEWQDVERALNLYWNMEINEAETIYLKYLNNPVCGSLWAEVSVIKAGLTETKEDIKEARGRLEKAQAVARKLQLDQKPIFQKLEKEEKKKSGSSSPSIEPRGQALESEKSKALYLLGKLVFAETTMMEAIMDFKARDYVKAGLNMRSSWKQFQQALEVVVGLPPNFPFYSHIVSSAYCGVGTFHFMISIVPPAFKWIIEAVGFEGDRTRGMQELQLGVEAAGYRSPQSNFTIILLQNFFFEDFATANALLEKMLVQFPKSVLGLYLGGCMFRKQGNVPRSDELFTAGFKYAEQMYQLQLFVQSELGYNSFLKLEWEQASVQLSGFLRDTSSQGFKAFIGWQLGVCLAMMGKDDEAKNAMSQLIAWVRKDYDYDEYAGRRAKVFLKNGKMTPVEKQFTIASLLFESTKYEEALKVLDEALPVTEDDKGCLNKLKANCYHSLGKLDQAKELYLSALATEKNLSKENIYVIPQSLVGVAEIFIKEGKKDQAKNHLKRAKGFSGYDWEQITVMKLKKALQIVDS